MPRLVLRICLAWLGLGLLASLPAIGQAAPPSWIKLLPFQKQATPVRTVAAEVDYSLTERHGPWLIMCTSFTGEQGEAQANELVKELRSRYRLQAFVFRHHFDYSGTVEGLGMNKFGGAKKMKPLNPVEFEEVAVMVGHFDSVNDPLLETTLEKIKYLNPACLSKRDANGNLVPVVKSNQSIGARMGSYYRDSFLDKVSKFELRPKDEKRLKQGSLGRAFVTRNPLLPDEFFVAKGLDPFVVNMNKDLPYSLLRNPKKYTVKVGTFRGVDSMKPAEFEEKIHTNGHKSKIDDAAIKARDLCAALRKKGVEAYEFHDVSESIVTIGSFDSVGEERADGKTEINPAVHTIMKQYSAEETKLPGYANPGLKCQTLAGIPFDSQPMPVEVPRQSLAANYNANNNALR
jgi:hypothetical protein